MTLKQSLYAFFTVLTLSIGQILFKQASAKLNIIEYGLLRSTLCNTHLVAAIFIYGVATFAWLLVIKDIPLSIAYPFAALAFVIVPVLAHFFLDESLSINSLVGAALIVIGVYISSI